MFKMNLWNGTYSVDNCKATEKELEKNLNWKITRKKAENGTEQELEKKWKETGSTERELEKNGK